MNLVVDSSRSCLLHYDTPVKSQASALLIRTKLFAIGRRFGFTETKCEQMGLVATEIISNQLKYAQGRGHIQIWQQPGPVLDIFALDYGPGITNLNLAHQDGYSSGKTLGKGLGSIQRLADVTYIYTQTQQRQGKQRWHGTAVLSRFHAAKLQPPGGAELGLYARALSNARYNGDHFYIQLAQSKLRWLHLDGLGHGNEAYRATSGLGKYLLLDQPMLATWEIIERQLNCTRGAVALLGEVNLLTRQLNLMGVGDMRACVAQNRGLQHYTFPPGILGKAYKRPISIQLTLEAGALLMSSSDGIRRRWDAQSFPGLMHQHPQLIVYLLGSVMGRMSDDQSLCAIKLN